MVDGWIILDKPLGLGSTQGVAAVKRNLRQAGFGKCKVGHGGTLDPLATGVLPIAVGEATKLCGRMLDASKVYAFTVRFGAETDTLDLEGKVVAESEVRPSLQEIEAVLPRFIGPIAQVPPAYSALMVDGERAYDLARKGEAFELKSRAVTIHSLQFLPEPGRGTSEAGGGAPASLTDSVPLHHPADGPPPPVGEELTLVAHVSKGTYIRSLARDIARALGTVGHVTMLRRLKAGPFEMHQAISLDKLNEVGQGAPLEHVLLPLEAGLVDIPALSLDPEQARAVRQGRVLAGLPFEDGLYWAKAGAVPVALVELSGGSLKVSRGFNLKDVAE
ncbi:tRNA pseudouridine(55) synthase TruB [Novosphingobium jiangmenense]|uniref:tRNA pseudouridine synthase B n=1 Tax=Novosphingobium jiangmenense TaxID=2791981 RepID=A0ABS0HI50_9SPHN|nr:tRNA pseudouridine(55) synthase TruB [Novosphingobium jiangmenense]MBF9151937.1 tRNA pseudouridine(55) synthase TruB [Novosphingobium jiangmenense]